MLTSSDPRFSVVGGEEQPVFGGGNQFGAIVHYIEKLACVGGSYAAGHPGASVVGRDLQSPFVLGADADHLPVFDDQLWHNP